MTEPTKEETEYWMRRYGWLRPDDDGEERFFTHRDTSETAMAAYRIYADAMKPAGLKVPMVTPSRTGILK